MSATAVHGVCRVAVELSLDYDMLKQRVALAGGKARTTQLVPRFVELSAAAGPMPGHSASLPECVVELARAWSVCPRCAMPSWGHHDPNHAAHAHLGGRGADRLSRRYR